MITAIAIDDEPNALGVIREYARNVPELNLIETFTDPLKAEAWLELNPETGLVFLDIQMARLNGLDLIRRNRKANASIILTTAYPDFALQGFELAVTDYLLKPFAMDRFRQALEKVKNSQQKTSEPASAPESAKEDIIFVKSEYRIMKVSVDEIQYLEGTGNYVSLHLPSGRILSMQNMSTLEQMLKGTGFFRIHRSYIVAIRHIESVTRKSVTVAGQELPIGDSYREPFLSYIGSHYRLL
ncbi:MAG: LytR/AlgR family response regulator transcription factor [bacterium]|jgi:two-component system LytT family response regulator